MATIDRDSVPGGFRGYLSTLQGMGDFLLHLASVAVLMGLSAFLGWWMDIHEAIPFVLDLLVLGFAAAVVTALHLGFMNFSRRNHVGFVDLVIILFARNYLLTLAPVLWFLVIHPAGGMAMLAAAAYVTIGYAAHAQHRVKVTTPG